jgi:hypothetical protein
LDFGLGVHLVVWDAGGFGGVGHFDCTAVSEFILVGVDFIFRMQIRLEFLGRICGEVNREETKL